MIFFGKVEKGKIVLDNPAKYLTQVSKLEGKPIELTLQKKRTIRSLTQNSYYWGVVVEILSDHFGYFPDEMHMALKYKFLQEHPQNSSLVKIRSTANLSRDEFTGYVNRIILWAATEYQIYIPDSTQAVL